MADYAFSWERAAMDGEPMPRGLPLEEQLAFQAVAHLYARYQLKVITRDDGSREKGEIVYQLGLNRRKLRTQEKLIKHSAALFRAVELSASEYAKNRTLENADEMYRALYGFFPGRGDRP